MNKESIDWESFARQLLWHNIVFNKNADSGYDIMLEDGPEGRNIKRGDIGFWRIQSYLCPGTHAALTCKGLAVALGLFEDILTPDGHDCKKCPERKKCKAYFKDDPDQERCYQWGEKHGKNLENK